MIWVSWRQHRAELLAIVALFAALAAFLIPIGLQMRHSFTTNAITGCIPRGFASAACSNAFTTLLGWLNIVPGILGAAVGAPLVAGEFEQGTFRFAFTQSVPRTRCILVRLLVVAASVVMAAVVFIALLTWTRVPLDQMGSRLNPNTSFDFEGIVGIGYFLFAFALGALLGALLHRVIPALVATLVIFVPIRLTIQNFGLSFLGSTTRTATAKLVANANFGRDYLLNLSVAADPNRYPTAAARLQALTQATTQCPSKNANPDPTCLQGFGINTIETYIPAGRFWPLQLVETTGYLLTALVLLALTVLIVRRRRG